MPAALKVDWTLAKALALQGLTHSEIAERLEQQYGQPVSIDAVSKRASREKWGALVKSTKEQVGLLVSERITQSLAERGARWREDAVNEVQKSLQVVKTLKPAKNRREALQHAELLKLEIANGMKLYGLDQPGSGSFNVAFTMNVTEVQLTDDKPVEQPAQVVDIQSEKVE